MRRNLVGDLVVSLSGSRVEGAKSLYESVERTVQNKPSKATREMVRTAEDLEAL